ncbi:MAG: SAM-dependent methyltransferase [Chromatiales bacterium]|jgi:hypothetical protein|nr:SAM-dependent methyltransferase [Chromatiales bacterium]
MGAAQSQAGNITMSTGGAYSLATIGAKHVIDGATPLVLNALDSCDLGAPERPFVMTDMGCADGGTSLEMIRQVARKVRAEAPERPIQIVYADQPRNDYNALVQITSGLSDFDTYLHDMDNLFVSFSATSFYDAILPAKTVDLGFSATAMHWLSRKPIDINGAVHSTSATGTQLDAFRAQARVDQERILVHRATELVSGGKLVLINFCRDEEGRYLGNTGGVHMFKTFGQLWATFVEQGKVTNDECTRMTLPQYYNTTDEFRALFADDASPACLAGLSLDHIETRVVMCPFAQAYEQHSDAARFAHEYIPTLRSWTESTFFGGLDEARPLEERRAIVGDYYDTYEAMVAEAPDGHAMDYVHAYMVVSKA